MKLKYLRVKAFMFFRDPFLKVREGGACAPM